MASHLRNFSVLVSVFFLCLSLNSCGNSPTRYNPAAPAPSTGLVVTATGNGQIGLGWPNAADADGYNIYYSTSPGVNKSNGTKFASTRSKSTIVTGLTNNTTYYFVFTSVNGTSESAESNVVSATPAVPGPFSQSDLEGKWNFNILVSGATPGWMRGILSISNAGNIPGIVTYTNFAGSSNYPTLPAGIFTALQWDSANKVRDTSGKFNGFISGNLYRDMIVMTSTFNASSSMIVILQKQIPNITFDNPGDLQGSLGGGSNFNARSFVYNQISAGSVQEWEFALGRINAQLQVLYSVTGNNNLSNIFIPPNQRKSVSDRASTLSISSDGIVTETLVSGFPNPPTVLIDRGVMSADKTVIVGVATDTSGTKYVLRIYQIVNINVITNASQSHTLSLADSAGTYSFENLLVGTSSLWASGSYSINNSGAVSFSSYLDSNNNTSLPAGFTLVMDASPDPGTGIPSDPRNGILADPDNLFFHGKLSYFADMIVSTNTDSTGAYSLSVALK